MHNMWVGLIAVSVLLLLEFPVLWKHDLSPKDSKNNSRPPSIKKNNNRKIFLMCFLKAKKFIVLFFIAWKSDKGREEMNTLQEKEWIGLFQFKRFSSFCIWTNERACLFGNFDLKLLSSFDLYRRGQVNKAN